VVSVKFFKWLKKWLYGLDDEDNKMILSHEERVQRLKEQVRK